MAGGTVAGLGFEPLTLTLPRTLGVSSRDALATEVRPESAGEDEAIERIADLAEDEPVEDESSEPPPVPPLTPAPVTGGDGAKPEPEPEPGPRTGGAYASAPPWWPASGLTAPLMPLKPSAPLPLLLPRGMPWPAAAAVAAAAAAAEEPPRLFEPEGPEKEPELRRGPTEGEPAVPDITPDGPVITGGVAAPAVTTGLLSGPGGKVRPSSSPPGGSASCTARGRTAGEMGGLPIETGNGD
jgi:hypothetical protein